MNPVDLNNFSPSALNFEVGDSKVRLQNHGIISPNNNIFAAKYGDVWNNPAVINAISKYYQLADDGSANLMFLQCMVIPTANKTTVVHTIIMASEPKLCN
jgi:hypothetical protein